MRYGLKQGDELHKITRGVNGSGHRTMELFGDRRQSRSFSMSSPKDPSDLVGQHLDPQAGDEAGQHRPGEEIGEKRQPEKPEHKEQQAAHQSKGQGILHPQRVSYRSKANKHRSHDRSNGGIRASHDMARAGEEGKYREWNDARIEAKHRRQPGHLRISYIEGDDQRRQGNAG